MLFRRFLILAAGPALLAACASSPEKPVADYSVQPGYHVVGMKHPAAPDISIVKE